jgi:hypothetical protein
VLVPRSRKENAVDLEEVVAPDLIGLRGKRERALERSDVCQHALRGDVVGVGREGSLRQPPVRKHEALDPRRCDRLRAQQLAGKRLEARDHVCLELATGLLGVRRGGREIRAQPEVLLGDRFRHVGAIVDPPPGASAAECAQLWLPPRSTR